MKKTVAILLCFGMFAAQSFAQSARSRPRVAVTDNSGSSQAQTSAPASETAKRPPVLKGDNQSVNPAPSATPPVSGDSETGVEDDEIIKIETSLVTLPVTVLDRDGRFISGLSRQDFQIYEDGVPQKIEHFTSIEQPFTVLLLIDVSNSTAFKINEIQDAAISFVNKLNQNDRVTVISFAERVRVLTPPTNNRSQLYNAIRMLDFDGGTSLYEAVNFAINQEISRIEGRKAVVLFTDGVDTTSRRASYQSTVREAEEVEAMFYPIRFDTYTDMNQSGGNNYPYPAPVPRRRGGGRSSGGGLLGDILAGILTGGTVTIGGGNYPGGGTSGTSSSDYEKGRRYLEDLAHISGGRKFEANNLYNLEAAFTGIAEELRRQYSIGYYPENAGRQGQRKQVSIRVSRSNAVVRAKNSYIVGQANSATAKQPVRTAPTITNRLPF